MSSTCENCGCSHDGTYGSGRFCSASCARSWSSMQHRAETNKKVSQTLLRRRLANKCKTDFSIRYCANCGIKVGFRNKSGYCPHCVRKYCPVFKSSEYREKIRQSQMRLIAAGTHKGWKSRNIKSYAEKFFEQVLNNNHIAYERERYVGKYFLDFVIGNIDLEIDGKQHQYEERKQSDYVRDDYLRSQGYFVYRIRWNEINFSDGKEMIKGKIDLLLDFLDTYDV